MTYSNEYRSIKIRRDFWLRNINLRVTSMSIKIFMIKKVVSWSKRTEKEGERA